MQMFIISNNTVIFFIIILVVVSVLFLGLAVILQVGSIYLFLVIQTEPINLPDNRCLTIDIRVQIYAFFLIHDAF